jgi:hypothetical protein
MNTFRLKQMVATIPVLVGAVLLLALASPAAAQSEACVNIEVGAGYAATMSVQWEGGTLGPSNEFDVGQTQCMSLQFVTDGAAFTVQVNAIASTEGAVSCTPADIARSASFTGSTTYYASGTVDQVFCDQ